MIKHSRDFIALTAVASVATLFSSGLGAQVVPVEVTYQPVASSIPTLSSAMLIVLAMLLGTLAFRLLRSNGAGRLMGVLLALGALALAGGFKVVGDAYAPTTDKMNNPNGGTLYRSEEGLVVNESGRTQMIIAIKCSEPAGQPALSMTNFGGPTCDDNPPTVLSPSDQCFLNFNSYNCHVGNNGG
jgi:hypothetical protein